MASASAVPGAAGATWEDTPLKQHASADFTACAWNILADGLAQTGKFCQADQRHLSWEHRAPLICEHLKSIDADIVALPEGCRYSETFEPFFEENGFWSQFVPKAENVVPEYGDNGLIVAVRKSAFEIVNCQAVNFAGASGAKSNQWCAVLTLRSAAEPSRLLVVATAHFKAKPAFASVRTQQAQYMLDVAHGVAGALAAALPSHSVHLLAMGDFNGHPTETPSLYSAALLHPAQLCSAYAVAGGAQAQAASSALLVQASAEAEPPFTTFKFRGQPGEEGELKKLTIDYVMYSPQAVRSAAQQAPGAAQCALRAQQVLALPQEADIGATALPSATIPSDHLPVAVKFAFQPAAVQE